jgi:Tfp pilus assembly protein PilE
VLFAIILEEHYFIIRIVVPPAVEELFMRMERGMTVVELVVIICIGTILLAIAIPKFMETAVKNKMGDGMSTIMTYEASQLAYLAQRGRVGPVDSTVFRPEASEYFSYSEPGVGLYKATARIKMGRFLQDHWLMTHVDTVGGMPKLRRSCSKGDSSIVKKYISNYFK